MTTHPYCLLLGSEPTTPRGLTGIDDAPVRTIVVDDVSMWVSDAPELPSAASIEWIQRIQRHNEIVTAALNTGATPLPMRYGQRFESDDEARRFLAEKSPELRPLFARVAGMVEMAVIVAPALKKTLRDLEPVSPAVLDATARGAGLGYLNQVRDRTMREQRTRSVVEKALDRASEAVRGFTRAEQREVRSAIGVVAHLVARADVEEYRERVLALRDTGEWQFLPSGPRAPYSFCAVGDGGGASGTLLAT
jgi:gas vesicle protein GvpL/GvpF